MSAHSDYPLAEPAQDAVARTACARSRPRGNSRCAGSPISLPPIRATTPGSSSSNAARWPPMATTSRWWWPTTSGDESKDGVRIVDVGRLPGRLNRIFTTTRRVFDKAVALDADVYHLHDPELIPDRPQAEAAGQESHFRLARGRAAPIARANPTWARCRAACCRAGVFPVRALCLSRASTASSRRRPFIRDKFLQINPNTVDVNNFPLIGELDAAIAMGQQARRGLLRRRHRRHPRHPRAGPRLRPAALAGAAEPGRTVFRACARGGSEGLSRLGAGQRARLPRPRRRARGDGALGGRAGHASTRCPTTSMRCRSRCSSTCRPAFPVIASNFPLWRDIIEGNRLRPVRRPARSEGDRRRDRLPGAQPRRRQPHGRERPQGGAGEIQLVRTGQPS